MKMIDLIIPTYNRPKFLHRILEYYNLYKINFNIIIIDSSSQANKKINRRISTSFPKLKIYYIDKFPEKLPPHIKYGKMLEYAKSKYVCFCPDDDFIIPGGIKECVQFLEKNPDYSVAHGTYISFYKFNNPLGRKEFWWRYIYPYESIVSSNPAQRLSIHLRDYYQVLWAVRRTDVTKNCYKEFLKSGVDPFLFGELLPDMLTLISGKMKRLKTLYSARQVFSTSYSYWPSLKDAISQGVYDIEFYKFKKCLIRNLLHLSNISKKDAEKIIDSSMEIYLKTAQQEHLTGRVNLILRQFPSVLSRGLRLLHVIYLFSKDKKDTIGLVDKSSSKYFNDFNMIRKIVLKHED